MDGLSDRKLVTSFNSPPHKEDDYICPNLHSHFLSFNSHPHKEDDENSDDIATSEELSTHILTRRMTTFSY